MLNPDVGSQDLVFQVLYFQRSSMHKKNYYYLVVMK